MMKTQCLQYQQLSAIYDDLQIFFPEYYCHTNRSLMEKTITLTLKTTLEMMHVHS